MAWKSSFQQNYQTTFSPIVQPFAARISLVVVEVEALAVKFGTSKRGGKAMANSPKNLPRMQRTRAISVPDWAMIPAQTRPRAE
jgi:hypothetical protein